MKKIIFLLLFCLVVKLVNAKCGFHFNYHIYSLNTTYLVLYNPEYVYINYGDSVLLISYADLGNCGGMSNAQWTHNGNLMTNWISTPGSSGVIAHNAGTYIGSFYWPYGGGTPSRTYEVIVFNATTSVPENFLQNILTLHPNPFNDNLNITITVEQPSDITYEIFDMMGKKLKTFSHKNFAGELKQSENFEGLASGIYFFQLTLDGETMVKKLAHQ